MRTLKLKERDTDIFLRLEEADEGALLVVERSGIIQGTILLNLKQLSNTSEWITGRTDEWFKQHKVTSKGAK